MGPGSVHNKDHSYYALGEYKKILDLKNGILDETMRDRSIQETRAISMLNGIL